MNLYLALGFLGGISVALAFCFALVMYVACVNSKPKNKKGGEDSETA